MNEKIEIDNYCKHGNIPIALLMSHCFWEPLIKSAIFVDSSDFQVVGGTVGEERMWDQKYHIDILLENRHLKEFGMNSNMTALEYIQENKKYIDFKASFKEDILISKSAANFFNQYHEYPYYIAICTFEEKENSTGKFFPPSVFMVPWKYVYQSIEYTKKIYGKEYLIISKDTFLKVFRQRLDIQNSADESIQVPNHEQVLRVMLKCTAFETENNNIKTLNQLTKMVTRITDYYTNGIGLVEDDKGNIFFDSIAWNISKKNKDFKKVFDIAKFYILKEVKTYEQENIDISYDENVLTKNKFFPKLI